MYFEYSLQFIFSLIFIVFLLFFVKHISYIFLKFYKKTIDNFPYQKYNDLVMQLGISKSFKKKKGEGTHGKG